MPRRPELSGGVLGLVLLVSGWPLAAAQAQPSDVECEGQAPIQNEDRVRARNRAIDQALRGAVDRVVTELVGAAVRATRRRVLDERIVRRARAYVPSYRLLAESEENGRYTVRLRAELALPQIRQELQQIPGLAGTLNVAPASPAPAAVPAGSAPGPASALRLLPLEPGASGGPRFTRTAEKELRGGLAAGGVQVEAGAPATLRLRQESSAAHPFRPGTVAQALLGEVRLRAWLDGGQGHVVEREVVGHGLALDGAAAGREALHDASRRLGEVVARALRPAGDPAAVPAPGGASAPPAASPAGTRVVQLEGLRMARLASVVAAVQAELPGELVQLRLGRAVELELVASPGQAARVQAALQRLASAPLEVRPLPGRRLLIRWPEASP